MHFLNFKKYISNNNKKYDFVYIRYTIGNIFLLDLCKYLNKNGIRVIIEIPTYPYKDEADLSKIGNKILYSLDGFVQNRLKKYIYRIATTSLDKEIYGVKCINFNNGVNMNEVEIIKKDFHQNQINFIGVANVNKWHGYDRLILGLDEYYKKDNREIEVNFYIVGNGEELNNLKDLVHNLNLSNHVIFTGSKRGKELDEIYNKCDVGVSSLALFRAGGGHDPIKSKEYLAKGIPILLGYEDRIINMKLPFVFSVSNDNSIIDVEDIIKKYLELSINENEIREYACKNLSWEAQIEKVIKEINLY